MTLAELRHLAKERGLSSYSSLKKVDLINLLSESNTGEHTTSSNQMPSSSQSHPVSESVQSEQKSEPENRDNEIKKNAANNDKDHKGKSKSRDKAAQGKNHSKNGHDNKKTDLRASKSSNSSEKNDSITPAAITNIAQDKTVKP